MFFVATPFCFIRHIEKLAFTYVIADFLMIATCITIIVFASIHISEKKVWGEGVDAINSSTWLTMVGSAIYAFEGIGVVIPILEVTEKPKQFPKILFAVMLTSMVMSLGIGEYCLFVYGTELNGKPLITMNLPDGPVVWALKGIFSVSVIISISLCCFPANNILEGYIYHSMPSGSKKTWLVNF